MIFKGNTNDTDYQVNKFLQKIKKNPGNLGEHEYVYIYVYIYKELPVISITADSPAGKCEEEKN